MLPGLFFGFWRICEIVTLVPPVGMLAWFVHGFTKNNQLTPTFVLVLFIVSTLALAWAMGTLFLYFRARSSGGFVAFVDLLFFGALIAGVYELRAITDVDCGNFVSNNPIFLNLGPFGYVGRQTGNGLANDEHKNCSMLKASFAFGVMNVVFFFFTFLLAIWVGHHNRPEYDRHTRRTVVETRHRSSRSPRYSNSPRRSHHSHRSSHRHAII
ncbi:uncharacterized protein PV09_06995 [Verruconis gallopava]|uniref:MARVEL domain-containing protein n=1 Tax=Verruconis gallopava TaxID=253628 RepID=A0A0D1YL50_9PEZI|nr:uncharacterized protein PV09_06995 [Verruconis gallopava]KIW01517.1 hypothetical protein PV09_06995 [Verruconis gallopava]